MVNDSSKTRLERGITTTYLDLTACICWYLTVMDEHDVAASTAVHPLSSFPVEKSSMVRTVKSRTLSQGGRLHCTFARKRVWETSGKGEFSQWLDTCAVKLNVSVPLYTVGFAEAKLKSTSATTFLYSEYSTSFGAYTATGHIYCLHALTESRALAFSHQCSKCQVIHIALSFKMTLFCLIVFCPISTFPCMFTKQKTEVFREPDLLRSVYHISH